MDANQYFIGLQRRRKLFCDRIKCGGCVALAVPEGFVDLGECHRTKIGVKDDLENISNDSRGYGWTYRFKNPGYQ